MSPISWPTQTKKTPLFGDLLWSRPENKRLAGKLVIIGGSEQSFTAPAEAYAEAISAGIGQVRVVLPSKLQKTIQSIFPEADFAASTSTGSFSQAALDKLIEEADWSDGILVAGDLGHNSETAILLEKLTDKFKGQLTLTKDAADYFTLLPRPILDRPSSLLVISIAQLQTLAKAARFTEAFVFNIDLIRLAERLHNFTQQFSLNIILMHLDHIFVVVKGQVSITTPERPLEHWRLPLSAHAAVWWAQNPKKTFEALTTAMISN